MNLSSSSPFPTRWGQWPEFLISRMFCPGHPLGWSAVPAYPFGHNPSISLLVSLLVFFLALSCQQLLSLRCFLPFSACVHTSVVSFLLFSLVYYSLQENVDWIPFKMNCYPSLDYINSCLTTYSNFLCPVHHHLQRVPRLGNCQGWDSGLKWQGNSNKPCNTGQQVK